MERTPENNLRSASVTPVASGTSTPQKRTRGGRVVSAATCVSSQKQKSTGRWEAPTGSIGANSNSTKNSAFPKLKPIGRAVPLTVVHDYTSWRLKLLLLEKLGVHPLDQTWWNLWVDASGNPAGMREVRNNETLGECGIGIGKNGSKLALFAKDDRDPEDLAGLEMPMGDVLWETGGNGVGVGQKGQGTTETGFKGTGLHGGE